MEFNTQAEVLEYIGKNPNDRSLIQRMIIRGELSKKDGKYYLVDKDTRIKELEKELNMYKECYSKNADDYNRLLEEYEEYKSNNKDTASSTPAPMSEEDKVNREYYMNLNEQKKEIIMSIIDDIYQEAKARTKGMIDPEPEYKQKLYEKYGFSPRED